MSAVQTIGDDLVEIRVADADAARAVAEGLAAAARFEEVVPALDVVTAQFDPLTMASSEALSLAEAALTSAADAKPASGECLEILVHYGGDAGPDLDAVSASAGLCAADFIKLHTSREYPVAMIGFTPGFAYLSGLDAAVTATRLAAPRARVAAGSVGAIAGFSGIYPLAGPGGWPIVGRTDTKLFDATRDDPFLLRPGMRVRFKAS